MEINSLKKIKPADIQKNYADVFKGIGCIPGEHSIKIDSSV
jgi:hypothetical protein